jgi:hypothetical protein
MPSAKTDYTTGLAATGKTIAAQWPFLHSLLGGMIANYRATARNGAEPDDDVEYIVWGGGTDPQGAPPNGSWRIRENAGTFMIDERSGGAWVTRLTFAAGGAITATVSATSLTGSIADARVPASNVTQHATAIEAAVSHDDLLSFVANEHIDHATVSVSAGTGLSGGGTIAATRTLNLANTAVTPGTYTKAEIVVDQQGRITSANSASREKFKEKTGGDQTTTLATDTAITWPTPDVGQGYFFPGADSAKDYYAWYFIPHQKGAAGIDTWNVRVGTLGTTADASVLLVTRDSVLNEDNVMTIGPIRVANPTSAQAITLTVNAATSAVVVRGNTTAGLKATLLIMQASE